MLKVIFNDLLSKIKAIAEDRNRLIIVTSETF